MEEELNPYAAPKAEVVVPSTHAGAPRRPRVVKWVTFFLGFGTFGSILFYWETASAYGTRSIWGHDLIFDLPLFIPVSFFLCLFRRPGKISFSIVAFVLGWMLWRVVNYLLPNRTAPRAFAVPIVGERIGEFLFTFGLLYLFYRFTFGLPSRTYFGMVRQRDDERR